MKIGIYSTFWNAITHHFDYKGALDNWAHYADHISIAVGTSTDNTLEAIQTYARDNNYPVSVVETSFDFKSDPFAYGKTENAALQNCDGDLLVQQNGDERFRADKNTLAYLGERLIANPNVGAYFVPVINLYGSYDTYLDVARKWYIHKEGYFRGAVKFGLKPDGRPDYNKTSTDELIDRNDNLVPTASLLDDLSIESVRQYVGRGNPVIYHLGYVDFKERLDRSLWWKDYWTRVTGDENKHPTSIEEIAARETKSHGLPLWDKVR